MRLQLEALENRLAPALFTVTNVNDLGAGSLRQAISSANMSLGADTINFSAGVFGVPATIVLLSGPLTITDALIIDASAVSPVTVTANGASQNFILNDSTSNSIVVTMDNLIIRNGFASTGNGGGVNVGNENLTVQNCVIHQNQAVVYGGGIYVAPNGRLAVHNSTISGNVGQTAGGGLYLYDALLQVNDSTIQDNISANGPGITLARTLGLTANWTIVNSTISGNISPLGGPGGGILAYFDTGTLLINNSTITNNKANPGGGICVIPNPTTPGSTGTVALESSIVGNNVSQVGLGPDFSVPSLTAKTSWIGSLFGVTTFNNLGGNILGIPVTLAPLAFNGGPTQTHALIPGSAAIDAGSNPGGLMFDQRGFGFARKVGTAVDIGSFEFQGGIPPRVTGVTIENGATQRSLITTIDVAFDQPVSFPTPVANAFTLQRQSDGAAVNLMGVVGGLPSTPIVTLTFTGGAVDNFSLADGRYTLTVLAALVNAGGVPLDGNGDGIGGDNFVFAAAPAPNPPNNIFRLFGDSDGNGTVNAVDFNAFRLAYSQGPSIFDFDADNQTTAADFNQFRLRYGVTV